MERAETQRAEAEEQLARADRERAVAEEHAERARELDPDRR
jgi:hypothetical protein